MQINFTGRNIEVTEALKTVTTEKMERLTSRFKNISHIHVIFQTEKLAQIAEATLHFSGFDIHATAESDDMYTSIDEMIDKLQTQINKHKEKITDHR